MSSQLGTDPCSHDSEWSDLESVGSEPVQPEPAKSSSPSSQKHANDSAQHPAKGSNLSAEPPHLEKPDSTKYADVMWYAQPLGDILKKWPLPATMQTCKPIRYRDIFTGSNTVGIVHDAPRRSEQVALDISAQGSVHKVG